MAFASFVIKIKSPRGQFTISELNSNSTVLELKELIMKSTGILPDKMKVLSGFPPKPFKDHHYNSKLCEIGIESGETLIIQGENHLHLQQTSSENSMNKKEEVPMLKQSNEFNIDEFNSSNVTGLMMRYDVPSNNSCLFSSIYFIMNKGQLDLEKSDELRFIIATAVEKDPVKYNAAILGRENDNYCQWILNSANWGGAIELAILSEYFKMEICAIDIMSCQLFRFGESENYTKRCIVVYDGIHYDPLFLTSYEQDKQTIFNVKDVGVLDMALELAREARSSKQFTDVVNFKLKCNDCGQQLIGEKDATAHAATTGHVNFGELK